MITRDTERFLDFARQADTGFGPATARAAFLVAPDGFRLAEESAADNRYMAGAADFDPDAASREHRDLHRAFAGVLPTVCFAGDPRMPDAVFPNNVFATAPGRYVVGRMRHPVRQREAERSDIRRFFSGVLGYREHDLSTQPHPCELTGALVIDRARGLGYAGLSERCDEEGARLMHEALGLRATLLFDLAPGEYHTNVVLAILAGRAAVVCPGGFADPGVVEAITALYAPHVVHANPREHAAFVGNCIALSGDVAWMSGGAARALSADSRATLAAAGFEVRSVEIAAIEAGGGSLRCCVGEVY